MLDVLRRISLYAGLVAACLALTYAAASLALKRPALVRFDVALASQLTADYSIDPIDAPSLRPLDPAIVEAARDDERALALVTTDDTPVSADRQPRATATPAGPTPQVAATPAPTSAGSTADPSATAAPNPTDTPAPSPTRPADATSTPVATSTPKPATPCSQSALDIITRCR